MDCKALLAANSPAIGKQSHAAERPSLRHHGVSWVLQRFLSKPQGLLVIWRHAHRLLLMLACLQACCSNCQGAPIELANAILSFERSGAASGKLQQLPFKWNQEADDRPEIASFIVDFEVLDKSPSLFGLYIPSIGSVYEISLNGELIASSGDIHHVHSSDASKVPRFFEISPRFVTRQNSLTLRVSAEPGRRATLSEIWFGAKDEVYSYYQRDWWLHYMALWGIANFSTIVGLLALTLWIFQIHHNAATEARNDRLYLFAGIAELSWALRVADVFIETPVLPRQYWSVLINAALASWISFTALFCAQTIGWGSHAGYLRFKRLLWSMALAGLLCSALLVFARYPRVMTLWVTLYGAIFLVFSALFVRAAVRAGASWQGRMLAVALAVNVLAGCYDVYIGRVNSGTRDQLHIYYFSVLFGLSILLTVLMQFRNAIRQARELKANMQTRLKQLESELREFHARAEAEATARAIQGERTRILRDMHDGVGANLSIAMRQLESADIDRNTVLITLRESLDHLKMSIDALQLERGDVTVLLANMRYRLMPRFKALNLDLEWDVSDVRPLTNLDDRAMQNLQFILLEAISNVLQHARASVVRIELHESDRGTVALRIIDNGDGMNPNHIKPGGLESLRRRADALGALLNLKSEPGHTVVEIVIQRGQCIAPASQDS